MTPTMTTTRCVKAIPTVIAHGVPVKRGERVLVTPCRRNDTLSSSPPPTTVAEVPSALVVWRTAPLRAERMLPSNSPERATTRKEDRYMRNAFKTFTVGALLILFTGVPAMAADASSKNDALIQDFVLVNLAERAWVG